MNEGVNLVVKIYNLGGEKVLAICILLAFKFVGGQNLASNYDSMLSFSDEFFYKSFIAAPI
jgi:hypothetical protein